ncbi:MAG: LuxR C-terminal-related transcriptional regulator [Gordonia sp. (in: high G+C Gram-positive bacteria)]|uniref:helix-turn-helix transcriptional regulator n=1 Tax=Gordonia sp. (in: high G+C Gram-positive bacteria) TaxID=84139 RepID=UPI003BB4A28A
MSAKGIVGIVAEHDVMDVALVELVRSYGHQAIVIDGNRSVDQAPSEPLGAVVVRSRRRLLQTSVDGWGANAPVVLVESYSAPPGCPSDPRVITICADAQAGLRLEQALSAVLGVPARPSGVGGANRRGAVAVSRREREVLTTYALGATVEETAAEHFVATSTVRTHYRRVTARYNGAGRPVTNKAQLLLQLVADGWVRLPEFGPGPHGAELAEGSDSRREDTGAA